MRNKKASSRSSKLTFGIALFILGLFLLFPKNKSETNPSSTFKSEPVIVEDFNQEVYDEVKLPKKIIIPSVSIDVEVKKAQIIGGFWEVFDDSAGWGIGSGIPGEIGNQVIFAHAREGLFSPLQSIKVGSRIYVLTEEKWFTYEVHEIKQVYPSQTEVIRPTDEETLTVYTCSGFRDSKRLIVIAKRK